MSVDSELPQWDQKITVQGLDVITNFLNTTDYPKSMYHLFVGVYPNDPRTVETVKKAGKIYPNVHAVINNMDGPTTKAQNINHIIKIQRPNS